MKMKYLILVVLVFAAGCSALHFSKPVSRADVVGSWEGRGNVGGYVRLDIRPEAESYAYMVGSGTRHIYRLEWKVHSCPECADDTELKFFMIPIETNRVRYRCIIEYASPSRFRLSAGYMDGSQSYDLWPVTDKQLGLRAEAENLLKRMDFANRAIDSDKK